MGNTMKLAIVMVCGLVGLANAAVINLTNADFETGPFGNTQVITGWDELDGQGGNDDNYNETRTGSINSNVLHMKGDGTNWVGQSLVTSDAGAMDATTFGEYTVEFDYGYRAEVGSGSNSGNGDITVRVALWNITTGVELVGSDLLITDPGVPTALAWEQVDHQIDLTYDNAAQTAGDVVQVRFTHTLPDLDGNNWRTTAMFDNVSVEAIPEPATLALLGLGGLFMARRKRA